MTVEKWIGAELDLAPVQRRFLRGAFPAHGLAPGLAVLSVPRGGGKTTLAGHVLCAALDPSGPLFVAGAENVLMAGSTDQARFVFQAIRERLGDSGAFKWADSFSQMRVRHRDTGTAVRVISSRAKTALGIRNARLIVGDEPASWDTRQGAAMYDAIVTSAGKVTQTALLIGTRSAPGIAAVPRGWWPRLVASGSGPGRFVLPLVGDVDTWDRWQTIRKCNPLANRPKLAATLRRERDDARKDDDARRRFLAARLNLLSGEAGVDVLLDVDGWRSVVARDVGLADGAPIVGLDMGGARAWSAACFLWPSGRMAALAVAPGIPDLAELERRDSQPAGAYHRLSDAGVLHVAGGERMPAAETVLAAVWAVAEPEVIVCDAFRRAAVLDAVGGRCPVVARVARWAEATADVAAFRRMALDGPLSVEPESRPLFELALAETRCESDDSGNVRVSKARGNRSRDDLSAAATLAAGAWEREQADGAEVRYHGAV